MVVSDDRRLQAAQPIERQPRRMLLVGKKEESILQRNFDQRNGESTNAVLDLGFDQRVVQHAVEQLRNYLDDDAVGFGDVQASRLPGGHETILQVQGLVLVRVRKLGRALQNDERVDDQLPRFRIHLGCRRFAGGDGGDGLGGSVGGAHLAFESQ